MIIVHFINIINSDKIRDETHDTIKRVRHMGIKQVMLTGDNKYSAQHIAKQIDIDSVISNCLPEDKVAAISAEKKQGIVGMIGDGVNDDPALAIANIGIAMAAGSDVAMETSDAVLMHNTLEKLPKIIILAKKAKRVYMQNIVFSILVLLALVVMNVFQVINLPLGVVFHEGSTILVILNGL